MNRSSENGHVQSIAVTGMVDQEPQKPAQTTLAYNQGANSEIKVQVPPRSLKRSRIGW